MHPCAHSDLLNESTYQRLFRDALLCDERFPLSFINCVQCPDSQSGAPTTLLLILQTLSRVVTLCLILMLSRLAGGTSTSAQDNHLCRYHPHHLAAAAKSMLLPPPLPPPTAPPYCCQCSRPQRPRLSRRATHGEHHAIACNSSDSQSAAHHYRRRHAYAGLNALILAYALGSTTQCMFSVAY